MTASLRQAAQMALDALDKCFPHLPAAEFESSDYAAHVLRAALAVPDEPVAHSLPILPNTLLNLIAEYGLARTDGVSDIERLARWELLIAGIKCYAGDVLAAAAPVPVERQPLTDDEIRMLWWNDQKAFDAVQLARAVEKHHGIRGAA
jgi:hypothetical protein